MAINKELHAGELIKDMRLRSGISKAVAAELLGMTPSRLTRFERQPNCRLSTLAEIAGILGFEIVIRKKKK